MDKKEEDAVALADTASSFNVGTCITAELLLQWLRVDPTRIHIDVRRNIGPTA